MPSHAVFKTRIILLIALFGGVLVLVGRGFAQESGAEPEMTRELIPTNVYSLVLENLEFISITIILLSVIAVALMIQGFIRVRRTVLLPRVSSQTIEDMIAQQRFKELMEFTQADPSFISQSLYPALKRAPNFNEMKEAMETAVAEQTAEQFRRLEYLNILANLGPLLGLLGTVVGIMQAFLKMRLQGGSAKPEDLAAGISVALGTTLLGLMLAIPCLAVYGILRTKVDRLTIAGALQAEEFLLTIRSAQGKPAAPPRTIAVPQPISPSAARQPLPSDAAQT